MTRGEAAALRTAARLEAAARAVPGARVTREGEVVTIVGRDVRAAVPWTKALLS